MAEAAVNGDSDGQRGGRCVSGFYTARRSTIRGIDEVRNRRTSGEYMPAARVSACRACRSVGHTGRG